MPTAVEPGLARLILQEVLVHSIFAARLHHLQPFGADFIYWLFGLAAFFSLPGRLATYFMSTVSRSCPLCDAPIAPGQAATTGCALEGEHC